MQHGSKLQKETWFLESLEPHRVEFGQNDRIAEQVATVSLRKVKKKFFIKRI